MESCLATAQLNECNCSDAKFASYVAYICQESSERKLMLISTEFD